MSLRRDEGTRAGRMVEAISLLYRIAREGPEAQATLDEQLREVVDKLKADILKQAS